MNRSTPVAARASSARAARLTDQAPAKASRARTAFVLACSTLVVLALGCGVALAAEAPYGEVTRFGGFDATGNTAGKFVMPVGFAVEPEDPASHEKNFVYVLDRTKSATPKIGEWGRGEGILEYRLQKLSSQGTVVGSTTFSEKYTDTEKFSDAHPLFGLAVDPARKRVYAIVESIARETEEGEEAEFVPVVDEVVAWGTEPKAGKLERAVGFAEDAVTKSASLVAGGVELVPNPEEAAKDLFSPNGIVVDQSDGDVLLEAQNGVVEMVGGPTVLERIATEGAQAGKIVGSWQAATVAPKDQQGDGLFAASDGSDAFGVDLFEEQGLIARFAKVSGDFKTESLLAPDGSGGVDRDQAESIDLPQTPNKNGATGTATGAGALEVFAAGSPVTQLSGAGDLYAALYAHEAGGPSLDPQGEVEPWAASVGGLAPSESWMSGQQSDEGWAHAGVRLFEANGKIVYTIGGGQPNAPGASQLGTCSIGFARASLAAGAEGSVFVLTQPDKEHTPASDDEVIEFAPGGQHACPTVEHQVEVDGTEVKAEKDEPPAVTVDAGVKTKFDTISLDRPLSWSPSWAFAWNDEPLEWTPFAIEWGWDFEHEPSAGPGKDGYTEVEKIEKGSEGKYLWPSPESEHEYTTPGTYEARVRVYGDYGTSVFPLKVTVLGAGGPTASFAAPTGVKAESPASFDASASTPAPGTTIEDYEWSFGDGSKANSRSPVKEHTYSAPGKYTVKLTVRDKEGSSREATVEHEVTIAEAEKHEETKTEEKHEEPPVETPVTQPPPSGGPSPSPPSSNGQTGDGPKPSTSPVLKRPLTKAQKLAAALKVCKKDKSRKKRAGCEKLAKRRYGSTKKSAAKSKKK